MPFDRVLLADQREINENFDDNCSLIYLNEASLLNNIRARYFLDKIYVSQSDSLCTSHSLNAILHWIQCLQEY